MECSSETKMYEILIHITTWINLKNTMLSERRQGKKGIYCIIYLAEVLEQAILMSNDKSQISGCLLVGGGVGDVRRFSADRNTPCFVLDLGYRGLYNCQHSLTSTLNNCVLNYILITYLSQNLKVKAAPP